MKKSTPFPSGGLWRMLMVLAAIQTVLMGQAQSREERRADRNISDRTSTAGDVTSPLPGPTFRVESTARYPRLVLSEDALLAVLLGENFYPSKADEGDAFKGTLLQDVPASGQFVIPAGSPVKGYVADRKRRGGRRQLFLRLTELKIGDRWYQVETDAVKLEPLERTAVRPTGSVGSLLDGWFGRGGFLGSAGPNCPVPRGPVPSSDSSSYSRVLSFRLQEDLEFEADGSST